MRKNLDIPEVSVEVLEWLAKMDGRPVKNYMERILISHANDYESQMKKDKKSKSTKK